MRASSPRGSIGWNGRSLWNALSFSRYWDLSERTFQRKAKTAARLSPAVSDRLARLDRIIRLATEVLGGREKAIQWLKRPSRALDAEMPLQLLDTDAGTQRVERELRQILHGFVY